MNEIRRALEQTGAKLPLLAAVDFTAMHLTCRMWQEGSTVYLVQSDGTRAVGHWRAEQADLSEEV